ncbi:MAG: DUF2293 domain-containing protein [Bauldia sp.]|nr:DUF2293 domain-containing protein [Bauldia sp.]
MSAGEDMPVAAEDPPPRPRPPLRGGDLVGGKRFRVSVVKAHLRHHHPGLSSNMRKAVAERGCRRRWTADTRLGRAVGIIIAAYARHEHTDYDTLLRTHKLEREEARIIIDGELRDLLKSWRTKPLSAQ